MYEEDGKRKKNKKKVNGKRRGEVYWCCEMEGSAGFRKARLFSFA